MEVNQIEFAVLEAAADQADLQLRELNDLQLALVGGGSGDTILH